MPKDDGFREWQEAPNGWRTTVYDRTNSDPRGLQVNVPILDELAFFTGPQDYVFQNTLRDMNPEDQFIRRVSQQPGKSTIAPNNRAIRTILMLSTP